MQETDHLIQNFWKRIRKKKKSVLVFIKFRGCSFSCDGMDRPSACPDLKLPSASGQTELDDRRCKWVANFVLGCQWLFVVFCCMERCVIAKFDTLQSNVALWLVAQFCCSVLAPGGQATPNKMMHLKIQTNCEKAKTLLQTNWG